MQFANQTAARMADQMQFGLLRQTLKQGHRVGDRAFAQRAVFQAEDPLAVVVGASVWRRRPPSLLAGIPQLAETAFGTRCGAVQENQERALGRPELLRF
jgi:hypothetical protein